jgi:hypothetical protein
MTRRKSGSSSVSSKKSNNAAVPPEKAPKATSVLFFIGLVFVKEIGVLAI